MQQQSKAYHQAVEAYLEGAPLKAATHRKPVTLFGHQPKTQPQTTSRLGRLQAEQRTSPSTHKHWEELQKAVNTLGAFKEGVKAGVEDMLHMLAHPVDTVIKPGSELLMDMGVLAFDGSAKEQLEAANRMEARGQGLKQAAQSEYQLFRKGNAQEIAHELGKWATVIGGGAGAVKGAKIVGEAYRTGKFFKEADNLFKPAHILASSPSEIAWGYGDLTSRQVKILNRLVDAGDYLQLHKSAINVTDLASLTAKTGDEFALFTLGSRRIVVRGTSAGLRLEGELYDKIITQNYRWSAHTHPGLNDRVLMASGFPGDRNVLQHFSQSRSMILNSAGRRSVFDMENDYAVSLQPNYRSNLKP